MLEIILFSIIIDNINGSFDLSWYVYFFVVAFYILILKIITLFLSFIKLLNFSIFIFYYYFIFNLKLIIFDFSLFLWNFIYFNIGGLVYILCLLIFVAYYTLLERRVMGKIQRREGPNRVGIGGLLQPLADGLKLFLNEMIFPFFIDKILFIVAPILALLLSILSWLAFSFSEDYSLVDFELGLLFFFIISSFGLYSVILAGWSSNSKYAFLGAVRSSAQMVSYEVAFGFILIILVFYSHSLNLVDIVLTQKDVWFGVLLGPLFIIFYIASVAETNRAPFDLPEAESEIVAGYHIEYGGMAFSLFFLGEYLMMVLMCGLSISFFLGGWFFFFYENQIYIFVIKIVLFSYSFLIIRAAYPRYRYDQLMELGWLVFLPLTFALLFFFLFFKSWLISYNWFGFEYFFSKGLLNYTNSFCFY